MMNIMQKLISMGIEDVVEFDRVEFLHPKIEVEGDLFLGTLRGEQKLLMVKERDMDNSDGSEWTRPYQKKTCLYYLGRDEFTVDDIGDEEKEETESKECSFEWYWEADIYR